MRCLWIMFVTAVLFSIPSKVEMAEEQEYLRGNNKVAWACPLIMNPDWLMRNLLRKRKSFRKLEKFVRFSKLAG